MTRGNPSVPVPFRIAHLSDPHLSRQFYREHLKSFKLLLRSILEEGYDHIVISGDIVSTADEDDYYLAREIFSTLGLLNSSRLTVVPGNHDIFGGPHRAVDVLSFPNSIRSVDYYRRHELFLNAFGELFDGVVPLAPSGIYPFVKRVGPFALLGLNSVPRWSLRKNMLGTNGQLSPAQYSALESPAAAAFLQDSVPVAVMHHHMNDLADLSVTNPLWLRIESQTMRMRKRRKTMRSFRALGVQFVLHGHIHRNEVYARDEVVFLNGAGAVCDDPVHFLKYNTLSWQNGVTTTATLTLPIPYQRSTSSQSLHRFGKRLALPALVRFAE